MYSTLINQKRLNKLLQFVEIKFGVSLKQKVYRTKKGKIPAKMYYCTMYEYICKLCMYYI